MDSNSTRTTIMIAVAGSLQFLRQQLRAIRKYPTNPSQVIVLDDSRKRPHYSNQDCFLTQREIKRTCIAYGAENHRVPQRKHLYRRRYFPNTIKSRGAGPSLRTADTLQFGIECIDPTTTSYPAILDSDMVPIQPFDIKSILRNCSVCYLPQTRTLKELEIEYPWPGLFFLSLSKVLDFKELNWDCDLIDGVALDTGGGLHQWFKRHAFSSYKIQGLHSNSWNWEIDAPFASPQLQEFIEADALMNGEVQFAELFKHTFLHLRAGSNWDPNIRMRHTVRLQGFIRGMDKLIEADS